MSDELDTRAIPGEEPDRLVDELGHAAARVRAEARSELGITGQEDARPLRHVLREERVSVYPLFALSTLALVNIFFIYAFAVLTPDISRSLGIGVGTFAAINALDTFAIALSPLPMAWLSQRKARRAMLCIVTGIGWSVITIYAGFVTGFGALFFVLVFDGLTTGSALALHRPLLMDTYPPGARVRVLSAYSATDVGFALVLAPLFVALLSSVFSLTWRGIFVILGVLSLLGALLALRLRDPGYGRFDTQRVRSKVHEEHGEAAAEPDDDTQLRFFEIVRRLLLIPTVRRLAMGFFVLGVFQIPFQTFLSFFLDEKWGLGTTARGLFFAFIAFVGMLALLLYAKKGEKIFSKDPARTLALAGYQLALAVAAITLAALVPTLAGVLVLFSIGSALSVLLFPALYSVLLSIVEARWRAHLQALLGIYLSMGGLLGALFLGGIDKRFGIVGAMVALLIPGVWGHS